MKVGAGVFVKMFSKISTRKIPQFRDHSTGVLLSNNDSRNSLHSLVRGGRLCDEPLNIVSHGFPDDTNWILEVLLLFSSNFGSSPYIDAYPNFPARKKEVEI